ncbi:hypothetical protein [Phocaeicola plebeius]|uniref:hypothetical protein n=1 Tax=Phocaeicola plebeius TaxID=310297 RepID=UPI003AF06939
MAVPVELEIFMKDLTKAGLQSVGKNVDDVENQTLKLIDALKLVRAEQIKQLEANKQAGKNYTQEAANVQALTGQINGLKAGLKDLQKTKEEVAKTPSIDIDTEVVTRKTNNLKMQFSQVARELPSLAMGPQMFILAISNNLPMLADAIADVRKQNELLAASGQKGVPVWKQLGKALLSPQTALIALISLGIVYGKEIGQWIKKTFSFSDSLETLSESQKRYQEALNKGNAEAQNSITRLRVLYNAATDEAESTETRKKAIVALKKEYPDYFNKMSDENIMLGKSADAYERLTVSILAASRARASMKFLDENNEKIISLEQKITQEYVKRDAAQKELDKRIEKRNSIDREQNPDLYSGAQMMVGAASGRVDEIDKVIAEYRNQIYQLQKHNKEIELGIDVAALTTDFSGGSGGTGKKEKTDYASQLADARVKAQQTTEKLRLQIMVEGIAKRKALARQEYDEQLADIDKQERDTIAKMDKARKQGENIPQSQYDAVRQKSQEQRILVQQLYNDQLLQIDKEYNDKVTQSFIDYNKQYGTYQEKRLAIAMDYARKIAAAETEGDEYKKKALEQEMKESLSALDFSELKDSIDWEVVFGDLDKVAKESLEKVKRRLKQFKNSEEYKNMDIDQKKVIDEAINNIQNTLIDKGGLLADLPDQLKELAISQTELAQAQDEYNQAMRDGTDEQKESATKKLNNAVRKQQNAQVNVEKSGEKAKSNLIALSGAITELGSSSEMSLSQIGNLAGDITDIFMEAGSKIGGIIGAAFSLLDTIGKQGLDGFVDNIVGSVFKSVGGIWNTLTFGLIGNKESDPHLQEDLERLTISNEALKASIDNLAEKMDESAVSDASDIYEKQKQNLEETMANTQEMMRREGAAWDNGFWGIGGTHSSNKRVNDAMSASDWERVSKAAGVSVRDVGEFWNLTSEQMYNVANEASDLYAKIKQHADDGYRNAAQYMDDYIEYWKQLEELEESKFEKQTDTSFDSLRNEFKESLLDMESDVDDFASKFEKTMQQAMIESMMSDTYSKQLKEWYKDFANAMSDGNLSKDEQFNLRTDWDDIVNDALAEREELKKTLGWESSSADSGSSQSPSSGALTTMSQDSISTFEGIGRNMQTHLANTDKFVQEIRNTQKQDSQTLATIAGHTAHLVEIHDILSDMKLNGITLK